MKLMFCVSCFTIVLCINAQSAKDEGDAFFANGNFTKAIETYQTLEHPEKVYSKIGQSYVAIGNYGEALNFYKKAIDANPEDKLLTYDYAKLLSKTKKYSEAKTFFSNLIEMDSLNPNYHYELGIVLEKQRDTKALDSYTKTFDLDLSHQKAIFKIAKHHIVKRNFETAHQLIDKGLETYADNVELISLKAQAYYYQEYYTHAVVWFNKLINLGEHSEFIHEKLSLSYAQNSDYEDAIYHRKQALKFSPNDANAIYVIGTYYESLSNYEKAEEYIALALKLMDRSLSDEYQRLGTIYNRQKKYEKAIKAFQKSLKEDPSNLMSEFFIIRTKDEFYADVDTKINMYQTYIERNEKSPFVAFAQRRLKELNEEKFLEKKEE